MSEATRSYIMSQIKSKNTKPELLVRKFLHSSGFRFRLHIKDLPGKPDLVFPKYKVAIFVHGCFWHGHTKNCKIAHIPKTRQDYWIPKIQRNIDRSSKQERELKKIGYKVILLWECQLKSQFEKVMDRVIKKLV